MTVYDAPYMYQNYLFNYKNNKKTVFILPATHCVLYIKKLLKKGNTNDNFFNFSDN